MNTIKNQNKASSSIASGRLDKAKEYEMKAAISIADSKRFLEESEILDKKINQITSGELRAGRDFIVQTDYNINPFILPPFIGGSVDIERRIIEKR